MNRRLKPRKNMLRKVWGIIQLLLLCGAAVGSGLFAYRFVREQQYLVVKQLSVEGVEKVSEQEVLDYAQVPLGAPLYRVSTDAIQRALLKHPDIATALVQRVPPDRIVITVAEHRPVASVAVGQGVYVVNQEGKLFRRVQAGEDLDLPVITGIRRTLFADDVAHAEVLVQEAVAGLLAHARAGRSPQEISSVDVEDSYGVTLQLGEPPVEVVLGRGELDAKLKRLAVLEKHLRKNRQKAVKIFLDNARHPDRVAVQLSTPVLAAVDEAVVRGKRTAR